MTTTYEVPSSVKELFENKEASYRIIDYTIQEMDNIESMYFFLEHVGVTAENIEEDSGTQVILKHPEFDYKLVIDAGGLGDFHSHGYDVSIYED